MLRKYFKRSSEVSDNDTAKHYKWWILLALPAWIFVSFILAQQIINGLEWLLKALNASTLSINSAVLSAISAALLYTITFIIAVGVPWFFGKYQTNKEDIGITRLPSWTDILISPAGLIVYLIVSSLLTLLASHVIPGFDINQAQDVGFDQLGSRLEYIAAFVTLVIIAPLAEEGLFRGYLYGKLKKTNQIWIAIIVTSVTFGALHGAWNLAVDTFALSVILCLLRESTGSLWASILLHMTKNGIAFYFLFINPLILATLVR